MVLQHRWTGTQQMNRAAGRISMAHEVKQYTPVATEEFAFFSQCKLIRSLRSQRYQIEQRLLKEKLSGVANFVVERRALVPCFI